MQNQQPIANFSQFLQANSRLKSVYEELTAIFLAVQKWRHCALGKKFIIRTNQRSLKFLLGQRVVHGGFQRWITKLTDYDFEIQYQPGLEIKVAIALSRVPPSIGSTVFLNDFEVTRRVSLQHNRTLGVYSHLQTPYI